MTIRLRQLCFTPKVGGLHIPRYSFGSFLTLIRGPNDAGKTPVMCGLFWALGGSRQIDEPLWSATDGVILDLESNGSNFSIYRVFSTQFRATISDELETLEYLNEAEFSAALLSLLNIPERTLLNKQQAQSPLYMSVLLPAFAVDQDSGWALPYAPFADRNFILDQREEVARVILNIGPRHDSITEAAHYEATQRLLQAQDEIGLRANSLRSIENSIAKEGTVDVERLAIVRERLLAELKNFDSVIHAISEVDSTLRVRVRATIERRDTLRWELDSLRHQRDDLRRLMEESAGDLALLSSNEVAADAFRRFCGNTGCQFFMIDRKESFGRRVLYWRDQLKDVMTALEATGGKIQETTQLFAQAEIDVKISVEELERSIKDQGSERLISSIDAVTKQLSHISHQMQGVEQIDKERARYSTLLDEQEGLKSRVEALEVSRRRRDDAVAQRRRALQAALVRWSTLLRARDIGPVTIDDHFRMCVDGNALTDRKGPSGSTRTRLVLAYHAALLETSLSEQGKHPPFLLLDSPKQQEIEPKDIAAFVRELRELAGKENPRFQLVIASRTDVPNEDTTDSIWQPTFRLGGRMRFAGPISAE